MQLVSVLFTEAFVFRAERTSECLRDLGLEDDALRMGVVGPPMEFMSWCHSIAGVEYGKVYVWGGAPSTKVKRLASIYALPPANPSTA